MLQYKQKNQGVQVPAVFKYKNRMGLGYQKSTLVEFEPRTCHKTTNPLVFQLNAVVFNKKFRTVEEEYVFKLFLLKYDCGNYKPIIQNRHILGNVQQSTEFAWTSINFSVARFTYQFRCI